MRVLLLKCLDKNKLSFSSLCYLYLYLYLYLSIDYIAVVCVVL